MPRITPLGAMWRGALAGVAGGTAQFLFLQSTGRFAPGLSEGAFTPPEREQHEEMEIETTARRTVEQLMQRGPLEQESKQKAGVAVHYAVSADWGALYGALRESFPQVASPAGVTAYSLGVWMVMNHAVVPGFRLGPPPQRVPVGHHAYKALAHVVYGAAVAATYEALRPRTWTLAKGAVAGLLATRALRRRLPKKLRPLARAAGPVATAWARRSQLRHGLEALQSATM